MRNIIDVLEAEFTFKYIVEIRIFNIALCDTENAHNLQRQLRSLSVDSVHILLKNSDILLMIPEE